MSSLESVQTSGRETGASDASRIRRTRAALDGFVSWLDDFGETSQDQYDFWATRVGQRAKALYYTHPTIGAIAVAPFVLLEAFAPSTRSLVRDRTRFPIADAHYALGFFALARAENDSRSLERAVSFLDVLRAARSPGFDEHCWGYPFDWSTSFGTFHQGCPLITTVPYVYEAFESGYEATADPEHLAILESIGRFAYQQIPAKRLSEGVEVCSYTPYDERRVLNANAYRAFLLLAVGMRFEKDDWTTAGRGNLAFVLESQRDDGSWLYAVDGRDAFVDNFHTCFVLKNLLKAWRLTGDEGVIDAVRRGYAFYRDRLLDPEGDPRPFAVKQRTTLYRRDLYDYAEGINLARQLRDVEPTASGVMDSMLDRLLDDWLVPDGHFVTRQLLIGKNEIPYHRWAQAQTFHALARVYEDSSIS